ncbi:MAG: dihydropteroate synthase-like protein [Methanocellales archaeon]
MDILIVTGRKASSIVRKTIEGFRDLNGDLNVEIAVLDIDIAAFTTPKLLRDVLLKLKRKFDLILVSGLCGADFSKLEKEFNVKIRLGPKHASDLGLILKYVDKMEFSSKIPACVLLTELIHKDALGKIQAIEGNADYEFLIKKLKIGGGSRMKVLAEIVDATRLGREALLRRANYYAREGADIIDLGVHLEAEVVDVQRVIEILRPLGLPLSIDSLDGEMLKAAAEAGADLILSLNSANLEIAGEAVANSDAAAVVIPDGEDLSSLLRNIERAKAIGIKKVIADPILNPIAQGFIDSLMRYYKFRELDRRTPLLFGVGNVVELIDADSIGVHAILAGVAMELNANILFTPEYSQKTRGSVRELKIASEMMLLARARETVPKDLGIDLLSIKEKRARPSLLEFKNIEVINAESAKSWKLDPKGYFKIGVVDEEYILALHENLGIRGKTAKEILDTILKRELISSLEHAAYLGRELMKAELALKFKRSYVQDDEF